ncbi:MAG TPA: EAL domain-containing protein [Burkholderiales bacterium]|nr:EAL domain-containing protein [Burkholderiales bacterium]
MARRIVALFVLCGLLPVAATILVSYEYVEETLVAQRVAMLRGAASNYATVLFDRLGVAERLASSVGEGIRAGRPIDAKAVERHFRAVVALEPAGARVLFGVPSRFPEVSEIASADRPLLLGAGRLFVLRDPASKPGAWMIVNNDGGAGRHHLAFELSPAYLWQAHDDLPYLTEICVLNVAGLPVECDRKPTAAELDRFRHAPPGNRHTDFAWESRGVAYLSGVRELFLGGRFGAESWVIVASQPADHALAPVRALAGVVAPIVLLGLLVAALLGLVHVRRTMQPLNALTHAAGRVAASDFDVRVSASGDDEFGVLASSFNSMSARLGRQFNILRAESEIDAVILSSADLARVVTIVLQRVAEMGSADRYSLLLADPATTGAYRLYSVNEAGGLRTQNVELSREELERLRAARRSLRFVPFEAESLPVLPGVAGACRFAFAFLLGEEFAGAFVLGYDGDRSPGSEDVSMLNRLGDRVAVALGTARRDLELHRRAYYDSLTQLPNRLLGLEELTRAVAACARQRRELAVMFVDLDGFSYVNDSLGHPAGDGVLVRTAARLRACVRKSDIVMRLGGDEFAVVLTELRSSTDAAVVARHVISALAPPFELPEGTAHISGSVGIALFPQDGRTTEELVKHADLAMYHAKQQGTGGVAFFEATMNEEIRRRVELERELREALDTQQMRLHYQPQLDLRSGRIVGAEALIRWMHPVRGMVAPSHFIEFAESSALIEEIGQWALKAACAQLLAWRTEGLAIDYVSVNVSPRQFQAGGFAETVAEALRAYDVPANALHLEVTESAVLGNQGAAHSNFDALNALGTPLELDDFGTGYSSLAHLRHLPVAVVKLDRAFISAIHHDASALAVVRAAIDMAHALGKVVVAEGVELTEQVLLLSQIGCDILQGYHLSAAVPAETFAALVRQRATDSVRVAEALLQNVAPPGVRGERRPRESRT